MKKRRGMKNGGENWRRGISVKPLKHGANKAGKTINSAAAQTSRHGASAYQASRK
jgi:hypothetical protein